MSIEAMRLALDALEGLSEPYDVLRAQEALRAAIDQAQEPVAWIVESKHGNWEPYIKWSEPSYLETQVVTALYTRPQAREPLTDEQIESIWDSTLSEDVGITALRKIALVIEAAHGIGEKP